MGRALENKQVFWLVTVVDVVDDVGDIGRGSGYWWVSSG